MLDGANILICEDEPFVAIDLAMSVQEAGGHVVGPAGSVREAMELLDRFTISGAILDVSLSDGDVTPVAAWLLERGVPVVVQTGEGIPPELKQRFPSLIALSKPVVAQNLVERIGRMLSAV